MNQKKIKRNLIIGVTVVGVAYVVIWEKRRVDSIIAMSQAAVRETMEGSWEEGFKFGFNTARENLLPENLESVRKLAKQTSMEDLYNLGRPLNQGTLAVLKDRALEEKFPTLSH